MRVLHIVKTTDGASWAALQATKLVNLGVDIHVALPSLDGKCINDWIKSGAKIHLLPINLHLRKPWKNPILLRNVKKLVEKVTPDLIHSHFVITTLILRFALGKNSHIPRIFQVPGPLHMEHWPYKILEPLSAGHNDFWICSSKYTFELYRHFGIPLEKLFLSYYGVCKNKYSFKRSNVLREKLGIEDNQYIVGNINYFYPPKYYLGQCKGLKNHEDIIYALGMVIKERENIVGVLLGGSIGNAKKYEYKLRKRANIVGGKKIIMPGLISHNIVKKALADFDCIVHMPLSENCGGVHESLLVSVPTIAGRVGGLPELIIDNITGKMVYTNNPHELARSILEVIDNIDKYRILASNGKKLVSTMFDINRTSLEILDIYKFILDPTRQKPEIFDSLKFLKEELNIKIW